MCFCVFYLENDQKKSPFIKVLKISWISINSKIIDAQIVQKLMQFFYIFFKSLIIPDLTKQAQQHKPVFQYSEDHSWHQPYKQWLNNYNAEEIDSYILS